MSGLPLLVIGLCLGTTPDEAGRLIAQLGATRYADREAAATSLRQLGRQALPTLRNSRQSRDPEVRTRVDALILKIEGSLLLEATPVQLDFRERPLDEVIRTINGRNGTQLSLAPSPRGAWSSRSVTLVSDRPVPFWEALGRLCDAAGLEYSLAGTPALNSRANAVILSPGENRPGGPMSDFGPIRVNLISLHYQRDLVFGQFATHPGSKMSGQAPAMETFDVRMQVAAEPRLSLRQSGPPTLSIATDELGQSLLQAAPPTAQNVEGMTRYLGGGSGAIQLQLPLKRPDKPGRLIRRLKGVVPVMVASRRPDPLSIPLDGVERKSARNEDAEVVVHEIKPGQNPGQQSLEVSITPEATRVGAYEPSPEFGLGRQMSGEFGPLQVEILDGSGSPLTWYTSSQTNNGDERRLILITIAGPSGSAPATLRYHGTIRTSLEVPFEFRDLPMP